MRHDVTVQPLAYTSDTLRINRLSKNRIHPLERDGAHVGFYVKIPQLHK